MFDYIGAIVLVWFLIVFSLAASSCLIYNCTGVVVGTQGTMLLLGSFVFTSFFRYGFSMLDSVMLSIVFSITLGCLHKNILYTVGPYLFLLICIAFDVFVHELWTALPTFTGGAGGLIVSTTSIEISLILCILSGLITICTCYLCLKINPFWWSSIRALGWHAGLYGVDDLKSIYLLFILYGMIVGLCGSALTLAVGYVSPAGLGLNFTMAIIMISLYSPRINIYILSLLALIYSFFRTILRQSVTSTPTTSFAFEILFPVILAAILCFKLVYAYRGTRNNIV